MIPGSAPCGGRTASSEMARDFGGIGCCRAATTCFTAITDSVAGRTEVWHRSPCPLSMVGGVRVGSGLWVGSVLTCCLVPWLVLVILNYYSKYFCGFKNFTGRIYRII